MGRFHFCINWHTSLVFSLGSCAHIDTNFNCTRTLGTNHCIVIVHTISLVFFKGASSPSGSGWAGSFLRDSWSAPKRRTVRIDSERRGWRRKDLNEGFTGLWRRLARGRRSWLDRGSDCGRISWKIRGRERKDLIWIADVFEDTIASAGEIDFAAFLESFVFARLFVIIGALAFIIVPLPLCAASESYGLRGGWAGSFLNSWSALRRRTHRDNKCGSFGLSRLANGWSRRPLPARTLPARSRRRPRPITR